MEDIKIMMMNKLLNKLKFRGLISQDEAVGTGLGKIKKIIYCKNYPKKYCELI